MRILPVLLGALAVGLSACGSATKTPDMDTGATIVANGTGRLTLGVKSYLWHASLDTLSVRPLQSADPLSSLLRGRAWARSDAGRVRSSDATAC